MDVNGVQIKSNTTLSIFPAFTRLVYGRWYCWTSQVIFAGQSLLYLAASTWIIPLVEVRSLSVVLPFRTPVRKTMRTLHNIWWNADILSTDNHKTAFLTSIQFSQFTRLTIRQPQWANWPKCWCCITLQSCHVSNGRLDGRTHGAHEGGDRK